MLAMPSPTPYDLRFRVAGIPVYVTPWFWAVTAMMGFHQEDPKLTLVWIGCVFASILAHELGHGLVGKAFGHHPTIALYWMGGLCTADDSLPTGKRVAVLLSGVGAQFALLALILATGGWLFGISWRGGLFVIDQFLPVRLWGVNPRGAMEFLGAYHTDRIKTEIYWDLVQINLLWPFLNLLPLWPLDGGQVSAVLLRKVNRYNAMQWAHIVSMLVGAVLAAIMLKQEQKSRAFLFGYLAFVNFQALQALQQRSKYGIDDDAGWWKR